MRRYIFLVFLFCWSNSVLSAYNRDSIELDIVWANRIYNDREAIVSDNNFVFRDWFVQAGDEERPEIYFFDKKTGVRSKVYTHEGLINSKVFLLKRIENVFIGITNDGLLAFDLETRTFLWEIYYKANNLYSVEAITAHDGYLYHPITYLMTGVSGVAYINKIDLKSGKHELIYKVKPKSKDEKVYYPDLSPVAVDVGKKMKGRASLIFNCGWYCPTVEGYEQELYAVDLESAKLNWKVHVSDQGTNLLHAPTIHEDLIITGGDWSVYAFNGADGNLQWKHHFDQYKPWGIFNKTKHLIFNNRLYVNNDLEDVTCISLKDGEVLWNNPKAGANCTDHMLGYKDYLIFTSWGYGSIMVLDAATGELLLRKHRFQNSPFNTDISYDKETDQFFTSTYNHAVAFKIRKM